MSATSRSEPESEAKLEPIFISVKQTAEVLSLTPAYVYRLLDDRRIEARYAGRRRLVLLESVREYAASLSVYPDAP